MRSLLLIGGLLGFAFGIAFSLLQREPLLSCIWHGGLAALLANLLLPWWALAWDKTFEDNTISQQDNGNSLLSTSTQPKTSKS